MRTSLPILLPAAGEQRWSCHSCGRCCYDLVGHLTDAERRRIDEGGWREALGAPPYLRMGGRTTLNKRDDGACVFLDAATKRCRIHEKEGFEAKPLACRIYPFYLRAVPEGWSASLRFDCPSVANNLGEPVDAHRPWLESIGRELVHDGRIGTDCPRFFGSEWATPFETEAIVAIFSKSLERNAESVTRTVAVAASTTAALSELNFAHVREERFKELVEIVLAAETAKEVGDGVPSSASQRAALRELAYAHAEHLSPADAKRRGLSRWLLRFRQLSRARRFRLGTGPIPRVWGLPGGVDLSDVARVEPAMGMQMMALRAQDRPHAGDAAPVRQRNDEAKDEAARINELMMRYLKQRLEMRTVFGHGYYGWPMLDGLLALWGSFAVVGYLGRVFARAAGRKRLLWEDVFEALRIVDRAALRAPALGRGIERWRIRWLARGGGLARLIQEFALT